jgi:Zn-dependent protease with chaperone function
MVSYSKIIALQKLLKKHPHKKLIFALQKYSHTNSEITSTRLHQIELFYLALLMDTTNLIEATRNGLPTTISPERLEKEIEIYIQPSLSVAKRLELYLHPPLDIEKIIRKYQPFRISIGHIPPHKYQNPEELELLEKMGNPPFETLARTLSKEIAERSFAIRNNGSAVLVSEKQLPELHCQFQELCNTLGIDPIPDLFVARGSLNAYTSGIENPFIVIHDSVLQLPPAEVDFILGHELGHIAFDHMLLQMVAQATILQKVLLAPTVLISRLLGYGLQHHLRKWVRKAELSCDRAGLLACQDPHATIRVMLRFAGAPNNLIDTIDVTELLRQSDAISDNSEGLLGGVLQNGNRTHPWTIQRIKSLHEWIQSGEYQQLLDNGIEENNTPLTNSNDEQELYSYIQIEILKIKTEYRAQFKQSTISDRRYQQRSFLQRRLENIANVVEESLNTTIPQPKLHLTRRTKLQDSSVIGEAASLSVGMFLFPTAPLWMSAIGLGMGISSIRDAKSQRIKRQQQLLWEHFEEVDLWLCECEEHLLEKVKQSRKK